MIRRSVHPCKTLLPSLASRQVIREGGRGLKTGDLSWLFSLGCLATWSVPMPSFSGLASIRHGASKNINLATSHLVRCSHPATDRRCFRSIGWWKSGGADQWSATLSSKWCQIIRLHYFRRGSLPHLRPVKKSSESRGAHRLSPTTQRDW